MMCVYTGKGWACSFIENHSTSRSTTTTATECVAAPITPTPRMGRERHNTCSDTSKETRS